MFKVGYEFETTSAFTGGIHQYKVISRTEDTLHCSRIYHEIDGVHRGKETFEVHKDNGKEYVILWKYKGDEGRHYEPEEDPLEDDYKELCMINTGSVALMIGQSYCRTD